MSKDSPSWIRHLLTFILIFGAGGFIMYYDGCQTTPKGAMPKDARVVDVAIDRWKITAEVADTESLRQKGLQGRRQLRPGFGMLFIYPSPRKAGFWMKNTTIPLSIAFIKSDGTVVDVQQMAPKTIRQHIPPEPIKYALEVRQGYFQERGLQPPFKVDIPDEIPPPKTTKSTPSGPQN